MTDLTKRVAELEAENARLLRHMRAIENSARRRAGRGTTPTRSQQQSFIDAIAEHAKHAINGDQ